MTSPLAVTMRTVASLTPHARNARTHSRDQIDQIAKSISEFGWTSPILVDGENGILAGHGRLAAAKKLKMAEVPVIELAGLTEAQKRAYLIADNQLALDAGWDDKLLAGEVADLKLADFDLGLLGFKDAQAIIDAGEPATETGPKGAGATSLQYNIIFEDEPQRRVWFDFTRRLKGRYPDADTLGERLMRFLTDGGFVGPR